MKLRNKKTGEIIESFDTYLWDYRYSSLAELNEEWEDYIPQEPLIKDEKIRKAVRAWAEANNTTAVDYNFGEFESRQNDSKIYFDQKIELHNGDNYTITELCGEEEK